MERDDNASRNYHCIIGQVTLLLEEQIDIIENMLCTLLTKD